MICAVRIGKAVIMREDYTQIISELPDIIKTNPTPDDNAFTSGVTKRMKKNKDMFVIDLVIL